MAFDKNKNVKTNEKFSFSQQFWASLLTAIELFFLFLLLP